ncbi:MAG: N(5)-(carboxyethyl)ornithine synthase [Bacilli bacterium]|nr:N(5)-(carboxyethyl)ornithine synthase [Bacilli bacterium]
MKELGFIKSHKNGEKRIGLIPEILEGINQKEKIFIEKDYGKDLGYEDVEYAKYGVNIVDRSRILKCDIIVDVKLGDADYLDEIEDNKILFGWAHAVQNIDFTTKMINKKCTVIAWEEMYEKGRYIFYKNRELAGEAGVLQAILYSGIMPYDAKVAIIGNGKTAKGACRVLNGLGADVDIYNRKLEKLFQENIGLYDYIINCVMWDTSRKDKLIYRKDLKKMKENSIIIDISCDPYLEIETSHPTTIDNPVYKVDGITHYAVDNTPSIFYRTATINITKAISNYYNYLIESKKNDVITNAVVIKNGCIIDKRITEFRKSRNII